MCTDMGTDSNRQNPGTALSSSLSEYCSLRYDDLIDPAREDVNQDLHAL